MKIYYKKDNNQVAMISENDLKLKQFECAEYNLSKDEMAKINNQEAVFFRNGKIEFEMSEKQVAEQERDKFKKKAKEGKVTTEDIINFLSKL